MNTETADTTQDSTNARRRCTGTSAAGDIALPVAGVAPGVAMRKSTRSKWRAGVLIGVHVLMAAHLLHYYLAGTTLSPLEPSESMYTLELGQINAGFIFFALALAGTVIFGRFFCGWGCHLVAYQDFCGWLMKKAGVKPKPFRSRFLVFVPLVVALYMFVWPSFKRLLFTWPAFARLVSESPGFLYPIFGSSPPPFPAFSNHITTAGFWDTFPGPVFALLTVGVCGFVIIYFLGAKGFCTYGCPYGGFFSLLDKASVGRILVNDSCEQCGHCTATCTSNVRVHEEVKLYGMVVDPGCMKCMDCVTVCPNNALRFGFAAPPVLRPKTQQSRAPTKYDFTLAEEILLVLLFVGATLSFRRLYDGPPLLMSLGLAGITSYVAMKLLRLVRTPTVRIQNLRIKTAGRIGASGRVFAVATVLWLTFTAHSGFVQWHRACGRHHLNQNEAGQEVFRSDYQPDVYSPRHARAMAEGLRHFSIADRWGWVGVGEIKLGLAWIHLVRGEDEPAEQYVRQAIALAPMSATLYGDLSKILVKQGRRAEAVEAMETIDAIGQGTAADYFRLAGLLAEENRLADAIRIYRVCVTLAPSSGPAQFNLGGLLRRVGDAEKAVQHLTQAVRLLPEDGAAHFELGMAYVGTGRTAKAIDSLRRAVQLAPDDPRPRTHLQRILQTGETLPRQ